jgi:hypothetical protein
MSDVQGLQAALNVRPVQGAGFAASRTAVINVSGAVDGAVGNLTDCMHVDGTSGACGTGSVGSTVFVDAETPGGTLDGVNTAFTLANPPNPSTSLTLYRNGLRLSQNVDYTIATSSITFLANAVPRPTDILLADYRLTTLPAVVFVDAETPGGTIDGVNNSYTLVQAPNPASSLDVFRNGMRMAVGADYTLTGNAITFIAVVPQIGDVLLCSYRIAQ